MATTTKTVKVPNETSEEAARREDAERLGRELVESIEAGESDEEVIADRVDESEEDREKRRMQHISDERALADVGRVREISDSLERNRANYLQQRDNAIRRLRGLAGNPNKVVHDAVMAVAARHDIKVTPKGLTQPKSMAKPGDHSYPFADGK
jgi:hypothetical protein